MAMITHHLQGSCSTFPSVSSSWTRGSKVKHILPTLCPVGRKDRLISLKCRSGSRVAAAIVLGPKAKLFRISAFKGSNRHDDSGGRANSSKSVKKTVKISFLQDESEESSLKSSKVQDVVPAPCSTADERASRSMAIQKLFKNWLMLLLTSPQTELVEGPMEEPSSTGSSEVPQPMQKQEKDELVKASLRYFLSLDSTIKIPLLIFAPLYLAINVMYGSEASKDLTPLWVFGPLIMALYVKMFRAIGKLYIWTFSQTVKLVKNLPIYCLLVYKYIVHGKLKEAIGSRLHQSLFDTKGMSYSEAARRKLKDLQGLLYERYLDYIESIWPFYCRTIRFLKRANLI